MPFNQFSIAVGLGCKVSCAYCPQDRFVPAYKALGGPTELTPELLRKYLRTVPRDQVLVWSGFSEVFLNPHFPDMIRECHADGWTMRLDSTLLGCTIESAKLVASIPWLYIKIHVPSRGDKMRVPMTPEYLEVLRIASSSDREKCYVYFGEMYPEIQAIIDAAPGKKTYYTKLHTRAGNLELVQLEKPKRQMGTIRECLWFSRAHLLPNGACCLCCEDWGLQHIVGDLNFQSYEDIFKTPEFAELRSRHQDDSKPLLCRTCTSGYYS